MAVTGANGWIGAEVCRWLEANGYCTRRIARTDILPNSVRIDLGVDISSHTWLKALGGCHALVHCAAHVHRPIETAREKELFLNVNDRGTERLLDGCAIAGVRRFILASTMAVYDWTLDSRARVESDPLGPISVYGLSKQNSESRVIASDRDWIIARLATVYGAGDHANFNRLAVALRNNRFALPGNGVARKSVLPISRAGELLGRLAVMNHGSGTIVNIAAPIAPTLAEICSAFSAECGFGEPIRIPMTIMRMAALLGDGISHCGVRVPLSSAVLKKLTTDTILNVSRMELLFENLCWETFAETLRGAAHHYSQALIEGA